MRKLLSILVASVAAFSMLAVTVSAADYPTPPSYTVEVTDTVKADDIKDALKSDKPVINIGDGDVQLSKDAISEIAKGGKTVTFTADVYTITIDPKDITNGAKAINLNMDIKSATKVEGTDAKAVIIQPSASGDFGFSLTVKIPASVLTSVGVKAADAKAYYVADNGSIKKQEMTAYTDGSASVKFNHASYYAITEKTLAETGSTGGNGGANPSTGVPIAIAGVGIAGLVAFASKRSKGKK